MIEILSDTFHIAVRQNTWNSNIRALPADAEIETLRRKNDAKQRWKKIAALRGARSD